MIHHRLVASWVFFFFFPVGLFACFVSTPYSKMAAWILGQIVEWGVLPNVLL